MFTAILFCLVFQSPATDMEKFLENNPITFDRSQLAEPEKLQIEEVQFLISMVQKVPAENTVESLDLVLELLSAQVDPEPVIFDENWLMEKTQGIPSFNVDDAYYFILFHLENGATLKELDFALNLLADNLPKPNHGFGQNR